jgi:hypothetical protein
VNLGQESVVDTLGALWHYKFKSNSERGTIKIIIMISFFVILCKGSKSHRFVGGGGMLFPKRFGQITSSRSYAKLKCVTRFDRNSASDIERTTLTLPFSMASKSFAAGVVLIVVGGLLAAFPTTVAVASKECDSSRDCADKIKHQVILLLLGVVVCYRQCHSCFPSSSASQKLCTPFSNFHLSCQFPTTN